MKLYLAIFIGAVLSAPVNEDFVRASVGLPVAFEGTGESDTSGHFVRAAVDAPHAFGYTGMTTQTGPVGQSDDMEEEETDPYRSADPYHSLFMNMHPAVSRSPTPSPARSPSNSMTSSRSSSHASLSNLPPVIEAAEEEAEDDIAESLEEEVMADAEIVNRNGPEGLASDDQPPRIEGHEYIHSNGKYAFYAPVAPKKKELSEMTREELARDTVNKAADGWVRHTDQYVDTNKPVADTFADRVVIPARKVWDETQAPDNTEFEHWLKRKNMFGKFGKFMKRVFGVFFKVTPRKQWTKDVGGSSNLNQIMKRLFGGIKKQNL